MALDVEKEIKIYLILGFIVMIIFGLWYFVSPESLVVVFNWPFWDPYANRTIGAFFIAWAIIVLKLYFKDIDQWEKLENWVIFGTLVQIMGIISSTISLVLYNIPISGFLTGVIINIFFIILGIHILMQKRE